MDFDSIPMNDLYNQMDAWSRTRLKKAIARDMELYAMAQEMEKEAEIMHNIVKQCDKALDY